VSMVEEDSAPAADETAPAPQAESEAPAVEASIIEGECTAHERSSPRGVVVAAKGD
jgi:hypothetical protein